MKNVYTLGLLLLVTCILLSSCSQLSMKQKNLATLYVGVNTEKNDIALQFEGENFQSKGVSQVQPEKVIGIETIRKETDIDNNLLASAEPDINNSSLSTIIKGHKNSLARLNNFEVSNNITNTNQQLGQYSNTPSSHQPLNYYNGSGRSSGGVPLWFLIVLAIFIPPLAVAIMYGISDKFWISLILTLCFWIPGVIYALIQVLR